MSSQFQRCSDVVTRLHRAVLELSRQTEQAELPGLAGREWYELLTRRLEPQLGNDSFLIVAVVGGTNIGKSVIFNHIAGERVSATSPMASGTKHPTVIVPQGFAERVNLQQLFPGFELTPWNDAEAPLATDDRHLLFWRESDATPPNLVVLDTPDIDSVAEVNWERADHIRQSADVLVAVLTQQKYNDAAVKDFFRKAAQSGELVITVFNQVLLPEDEEYWPLWMATFCEETQVTPHAVYVAPNDRRAAEANQLPFFERPWPADSETEVDQDQPQQMLSVLSDLRFGEIKLQTLTGALQQLVHLDHGVPAWLQEIEKRGREFRDALELLSSQRLVEVDRWPTLPNKVMIAFLREWWSHQRTGWTANVHGFYNSVGQAIAYPIQMIRGTEETAKSPFEDYKEREWEAILEVLERTIERLTWLRDADNPLLSPRLHEILTGTSRAELIETFRQSHQAVDFESDLKKLIEQNLSSFKSDHPDYYKMFRRLDSLAAAARPAVSVMLFMTGAGPVGEFLAPAVADSALQGVIHVAGDAVGGTVVTAVGDKVLTEGASTGTGYLEASFRRLHASFAQQRANWLAQNLEHHLLGTLSQDLTKASNIATMPEFQRVQTVVNELRELTATVRLELQ